MSWYRGATKRPITGHTDGPMDQVLGAVLHVNESNGNLFNWVSGDNGMSCHFEVYKDGTAEQYLSTAVSSWCQADGNSTYLSIETEGYATEALTPKQLEKVAQIFAWMVRTHGFACQVSNTVGVEGLAWHGMGGPDWGGHPGCPGDLRKAQRTDIVHRAQEINSPPDPLEEIMAFYADKAAFEAAMTEIAEQAVDRRLAVLGSDPHGVPSWIRHFLLGRHLPDAELEHATGVDLHVVAADIAAIRKKLGA